MDEKVTQDEVVERVGKVLLDLAGRSRSEFVVESNHVLGTDYTVDDIGWTE